MFRRSLLAVTILAAAGLVTTASAQQTTTAPATTNGAPASSAGMVQNDSFKATMNGSQESPATASKGTGTATAQLNPTTHKLTYTVRWQGLNGPATAAHFHGPAAQGQNAGVVVPLGNNPKSPIRGTATLTPEQQQQLMSGQWYVNVHTKQFPAGAIRGQMEPASSS